MVLIAEELATIVPIPEAYLADSQVPLWDEVRPGLSSSPLTGNALDSACFWRLALCCVTMSVLFVRNRCNSNARVARVLMIDYPFDWALVDVETSGLRAAQHRVLSVAVVTVGPDGRQVGRFSSLVDPGCDPGPVHIHGLSVERLRGAPRFEEVAERVSGLLGGRVMVAHNAQFDYDFLAREFGRVGMQLPVKQRLCTVALNRRVVPPTPDLRLGTLAAHYGAIRWRAHDALDDTLALAGVLRGSLAAAARLGLSLPLVACPPRRVAGFPDRIPRTACAFRNPGRLRVGAPLVQGMKITITGETRTPRLDLAAQAVNAGLNVMNSVSRHTSVLVTNERTVETVKARRARAEGIPVIDETVFLELLGDVRPGRAHDQVESAALEISGSARPGPTGAAAYSAAANRSTGDGPLAGRRVLVLGGPHELAAAARARVADLGGAAAVNLSGSVTDVLALPEGDADRRMDRIASLGLPVHGETWLGELGTAGPSPNAVIPARPAAGLVLVRGAVIDLPVTLNATRWTITAAWGQQTSCEVDMVAFAVDADEQVSSDNDFIFYGAPESPDGSVALSTDGPTEQAITVDLAALPPAVGKLVIAAAIDGDTTFGDIGAIEFIASPGASAGPLAQATLDAATTERTMLLVELYRRGPSWRLRAVGQGFDHSLDDLARGYGVDIDD